MGDANSAMIKVDRRDPRKVEHPRVEQVRQRVYQIACGYEDGDDADSLRNEPAA